MPSLITPTLNRDLSQTDGSMDGCPDTLHTNIHTPKYRQTHTQIIMQEAAYSHLMDISFFVSSFEQKDLSQCDQWMR